MKKGELVNAYLDGRIDRRRFVRGLVAGGVTATAAVTYADVLAAGASGPVPRNVPLSVYPYPGNDADGEYVRIGLRNTNNQPGGPTVIRGTTGPSGPGSGYGAYPDRVAVLAGEQLAAGQFGVQGIATAAGGIGVVATSAAGASLALTDSSVGIPPLNGGLSTFWDTGAFVVNGGHVWYCIASGVGAASKWARLSSTFVPLPAAVRVFDSRGGPNAGGTTQGPLSFTVAPPNATARNVNLALGTGSEAAVPAGQASAVLLNLAVVTLSGVGALNVYAHGVTQPNSANINWSAGGQVISNAVTSACDTNAHVDIAIVAGAGASTQFIVDVIGYYL